jgi:hypothetical protein
MAMGQRFGNIPQLREEAETNKKNMIARKQRLDSLRKSLKQQVQQLSSEYDKHKQALATNESAGTLEALETKLRHYEQNIYHLRDFIDSKEAETDYSGVYEVPLSVSACAYVCACPKPLNPKPPRHSAGSVPLHDLPATPPTVTRLCLLCGARRTAGGGGGILMTGSECLPPTTMRARVCRR